MLTIRTATAKDAALIVEFIRSLAEYERAPEQPIVSEQDILRDGFPPHGATPRFWVLVAEWEGKPAGFALYFFNYSTWLGRWGLYLEDLFVKPELRGKGVGKALLRELAHIAVKKQCYGMKWVVLDWNQPAIDFYGSLGAEIQREWQTVRIMGDPMKRLATEERRT
ncbi:MAG: GNAT family N-acetyltransferase [Candidatus Koribacter versatilis]|uniref:GNAT family N-acetyltransferase n=1 Tax=Candidatus Korobacter versatilis TaxID=658062 RepID=A0A932A8C2_9BACT|nr:GNAT family N-acetyltransferase [Candidatus Koribacter versatilis]